VAGLYIIIICDDRYSILLFDSHWSLGITFVGRTAHFFVAVFLIAQLILMEIIIITRRSGLTIVVHNFKFDKTTSQ